MSMTTLSSTMSTNAQSSTMLPQSQEVPLSQAFALLADEEYHDVSLKGTDGVLVGANRMALSVRSDYFKTMFKKGCQFKESTDNVVSIGFSGKILKAVVEYIHTNTTSAFVIQQDSCGIWGHMEQFQTLLSLTEAAIYFGLPGLCQKANKYLMDLQLVEPSVALAVLAASKQQPYGPVVTEELIGVCWDTLSETKAFHEIVLSQISSQVLDAILSDANLLDDTAIFNLIQAWSAACTEQADENHCDAVKALVRDFVDLDFVDPNVLSTTLGASGLVTSDQVLEAMEQQGAETKQRVSCHDEPPVVVGMWEWKGAKSQTLTATGDDWNSDILQGVAFELGQKYRWQVTTNDDGSEETFPLVWLGLAKQSTIRTLVNPNKLCGDQHNCWGVSGITGSEYSNADSVHRPLGNAAKFDAGSSVTMTLDLSARNRSNGSLSIAVNGQKPILAISNLRDHLLEDESSDGGAAAFVPAVSCRGASVTVVDVQRISTSGDSKLSSSDGRLWLSKLLLFSLVPLLLSITEHYILR
ncbi:expressed unknown protein [Seminavis robusta]|uniref:BTB domain-containing protein n=1 Tax=Seminavis robusta TaxID=568900 RepID=A0A9N8HUC2_9STRA|nr:expressed unknown protein [Seminavis robusta]|eukprot:Sro1725_g293743.1  (526) ;mRNA; r:9032-10609